VKAGISAYIVAGFSPERLETILDIAVARFEETRGLRNELNRTREALSDRKVIDKAKGILIAEKGMTEDEAYQTLRRMAMSQNSRMADMAKNLISITEVLAE
jgi:response regulator NasT